MSKPKKCKACIAWKEENLRLAKRLVIGSTEVTAGLEVFNLAANRNRQYGGLNLPNRSDWVSERLDRRVMLFLQTQM